MDTLVFWLNHVEDYDLDVQYFIIELEKRDARRLLGRLDDFCRRSQGLQGHMTISTSARKGKFCSIDDFPSEAVGLVEDLGPDDYDVLQIDLSGVTGRRVWEPTLHIVRNAVYWTAGVDDGIEVSTGNLPMAVLEDLARR